MSALRAASVLVATVLLVAVAATAPANHSGESVPTTVLDVHVIAADRAGAPLFKGPVSVRCRPRGGIFVVDDFAHRIVELGPDGRLVRTFGRRGPGHGELNWPDAVHWDDEDRLYVADTGANRLQVWTPDGRFLREMGQDSWWRWPPSLSRVRLSVPRDVWIDGDRTYVSDTGHNRVVVLSRDGTLIGSFVEGNGRPLRQPIGIAVAGNRLYVVDSGNDRVLIYSVSGTFLREIGGKGSAPGAFDGPHAISVGIDDTLYVTERRNRRVQVFSRSGTFRAAIRQEDLGLDEPIVPTGICQGEDGTIWIADAGGHRILKLRR